MVDVDLIRKKASVENGRRYFEERFGPVDHDPVAVLRLRKTAQADLELLKIAAWCEDGDSLRTYEELGGEFDKEAFGQPMFQAPSVSMPGTTAQPKPPGSMAGPKPMSVGPQGGAGQPQTGAPQQPNATVGTPKPPQGVTGQQTGA
jgi:hypothetical protein